MLNDFVEAILSGDKARIAAVRLDIHATLGDEGLVDSAGAIASFNSVVKIPDSIGIELDEFKIDDTADLREELGINKLNKK